MLEVPEYATGGHRDHAGFQGAPPPAPDPEWERREEALNAPQDAHLARHRTGGEERIPWEVYGHDCTVKCTGACLPDTA